MSDPRTRSPDGWMPAHYGVHHHESPNHWKGYKYRDAAVLHVAQGSYKDSYEWLTSPASGVSAHFIIANDGRIAQMVSVLDSSWANGLFWDEANKRWLTPRTSPAARRPVSPTWKKIRRGVNPNLNTVSIEREGIWSDLPEPGEDKSLQLVLQWLSWVFDWKYVPLETLIGHCHINPVDKGFCPGPHVDYQRIANAANTGRPEHWER